LGTLILNPILENSTTGIAITEGPVPTGVMGASNENMLEDMEGKVINVGSNTFSNPIFQKVCRCFA
jgi:hypothetical protein